VERLTRARSMAGLDVVWKQIRWCRSHYTTLTIQLCYGGLYSTRRRLQNKNPPAIASVRLTVGCSCQHRPETAVCVDFARARLRTVETQISIRRQSLWPLYAALDHNMLSWSCASDISLDLARRVLEIHFTNTLATNALAVNQSLTTAGTCIHYTLRNLRHK
jgi:hypothetical protein